MTNPTSRFGLVEFTDDKVVKKFIEKPKLDGFINIGFMVFNNTFLKYLTEDSTLGIKPLMSLSEDRQLKAFVHSGYFEPMDTYREYLNLNKLWDSGEKPWTKKLIENFYKNKKVLITGHTEFKGSWLSLMLYNLNAKVSGLSDSSINSGFYSELKKENIFQEELIGNINDYDFLKEIF